MGFRLPTLARSAPPDGETRSSTTFEQLLYGGNAYDLWRPSLTWRDERVETMSERHAVSTVGAVFGIVNRRVDLFSQVSFAFRRNAAGVRPMASDLFTTAALAPLDKPQALLARMELDVALAGNAFVWRDGPTLRRLVPWWVTIAVSSTMDPERPGSAPDAQVAGYLYHPEGDISPARAEVFAPDEIAHYAPDPDPSARFRGISYLRPTVEDVANHVGQRRFMSRWWENSATPNLAVVFPEGTNAEQAEAFKAAFDAGHRGSSKAGGTAFFGGGVDVKVVGAKLNELDAAGLSAQAIASLCMAAGVPVSALGGIPGMESTVTYNNVRETLRSFADSKLRALWAHASDALGVVIEAPPGARLWYDPSGIAALQADALDDAQVMAAQASTMRTLIDGGFDPNAVRDAVTTGDLTKLVHTQLVSVQLLPPGQGDGTAGGADAPADAHADSPDDDPNRALSVLELTQALQRIYLSVQAKVITVDEARTILNRGGAELGPVPAWFDQELVAAAAQNGDSNV